MKSQNLETKADETAEFKLCPTKVNGVRVAGMYDAISSSPCEDCRGFGIFLKEEITKVCDFYPVLCRRYYK